MREMEGDCGGMIGRGPHNDTELLRRDPHRIQLTRVEALDNESSQNTLHGSDPTTRSGGS